ncbi:MAG: cupredoxin domain-containing protein [Deltaproteobacteria bacterium]|nr:cupredoxin domain-containing protein [Deltaproteobacteria bacterium]
MKKWLALIAVLIAAGCAGAPVREEAGEPVPGETVVDILADSYSFTPSRMTVPAGKHIAFRIRNEATVIPHSFVLENAGGGVIARQPLKKGGETVIRLSPLSPGIYTFYCDESFLGMSHRKKGMEGKLEVKGE